MLFSVFQCLPSIFLVYTTLHIQCPSRSALRPNHGIKSGAASISMAARAAAEKCARGSTVLRMAGEEGDAAAAMDVPEPPMPPVPEKSNLPFYLDPSTRSVRCSSGHADAGSTLNSVVIASDVHVQNDGERFVCGCRFDLLIVDKRPTCCACSPVHRHVMCCERVFQYSLRHFVRFVVLLHIAPPATTTA